MSEVTSSSSSSSSSSERLAHDDEAEEAPVASPSEPAEAKDGREPTDEAAPEPGRMQKLLLEYGAIGIIVLLSLSALTWLGFAAAFMVGFQVEGAAETAGVVAAASAGWLLTKPIRIPAAVVLTPVVAALWHRVRGTKKPPKDED